MSEMTREMLDYPAVNPQTCILAVDNPESGYCIVPASAMHRYAESHDALVKALEAAREYLESDVADGFRPAERLTAEIDQVLAVVGKARE